MHPEAYIICYFGFGVKFVGILPAKILYYPNRTRIATEHGVYSVGYPTGKLSVLPVWLGNINFLQRINIQSKSWKKSRKVIDRNIHVPCRLKVDYEIGKNYGKMLNIILAFTCSLNINTWMGIMSLKMLILLDELF
jgi:hypothetical protein